MIDGKVLNPMFECNVEAAVKHHPNATVCLLIHSKDALTLSRIGDDLQKIVQYHNTTDANRQLLVLPLNLDAIFRRTPLHDWWNEDLQFTLSKWKTNHLSDAARLAFLWKYGGLYLDHDVMTVNSTDNLTNAIGLNSMEDRESGLGTSVMKFRRSGHPFLTKWLYSIPGVYNEDVRASIGPLLGTKLITPFCQGDVPPNKVDLHQLAGKFCDFNLNILNPVSFYPIKWKDWESIFGGPTHPNLNSTYAVHLWHDLNRNKIRLTSDIPNPSLYRTLAKDNCPLTYQQKF